ncbi:MAG TPA: response regulator [Anaerolineaceae bacterium]|nr:response regulator [Anaerolineaceae bacterium]
MAEKILIVDDDVDTLDFLSLVLTRQGYQVLTARSGVQAINLAGSEQPDLVILDIMMPEMNGYQVARQLRGSPSMAEIPILMYTARAQLEDKVEGYEAGVDLYLVKPVHPVELQANIKTLITRRKVAPKTETPAGYTLGVVAPRGGIGASTMSLNLAVAYYKYTHARVIAAEMRPGQGWWAQELGIPDTDGLDTLLRMETSEITASAVENAVVSTLFGPRVLLASSSLEDTPLSAASEQYQAILQQLAHLVPLTILDIGTSFLPAFPQIVDACREIILLTDAQPGSVKRAARLATELKQLGFGVSKPITPLVFNRARVDMALTISQVEEILGLNIVMGIPAAPEQAFHAAQRSMPITLVQPDGLMAQQYDKLAQQLSRRVTGRY